MANLQKYKFINKKYKRLKLLGSGDLKKKFDIELNSISKSAKEKIEKGANLGMSHAKIGSRIIRTPLGGFLNHSETPNCHKTKLRFTNEDDPDLKYSYTIWNLVVIEDIKIDEELTVKYEWYRPVERVVI